MNTYRSEESTGTASRASKRRARHAKLRSTPKRPRQSKEKDLKKYLTLDYVRRALAVIDHRLAKNDALTAKYVLEMYFGKASAASRMAKTADKSASHSKKKPNLRLTTQFFDKLAQKYFPKPDWPNANESDPTSPGGPAQLPPSGKQ